GIESTVLDLSGATPTILRPGAVSREAIESIIGPVQLFQGTIDASTAAPSPGLHKLHYAPITPTYRFEIGEGNRVISWSEKNPTKNALVLAIGNETIPPNLVRIAMPTDAADYARQLYAVLRHADRQSPAAIWIEMPPDEPQWLAVRDRLLRASREWTQ
ncbi:MAG TPA: Sua5 family C-terminal domain-containing protein, partial [Tepidisphaeraceae bacterium]|nr:Sua5 family C-terminal domain-containing protein [Tepidisphaeraceae bacterium]